jgi:hypothetical protein
MPLSKGAQLDFSAGMFRALARHLIPPNGAWSLENSLLEEDGSVYKRGGPGYLSTSAFGSGLRFLWDGFLGPGRRTVIANTADFGVLDGSEGPVNLGGAGLASPVRAHELAGILFIGGGAMYGGSRKTAVYSTGTAGATQGSTAVTGSSTLWTANVDAGMLFQVSGERAYVIASVGGNTALTLAEPYEGSTGTGKSYAARNATTAASPYRSSSFYAVAGERLWAFDGAIARFSERGKPHSFVTDDFYELAGGVEIVGAQGVGQRILLFTTEGVWVASNVQLDLTDDFGNPQHRRDHIHPDLILWSDAGIASYRGAVVAPCADGLWLLDGISTPELLSRSITPLWRSYVQAGHKTGVAAVYRSHYFLPILNSVTNELVDCLVCRLDRPSGVKGFGTVYPWTWLSGFGGEMAGFAVRSGGTDEARDPLLLGASLAGRVVDGTEMFGPDVDNPLEPNGDAIQWTIDSRDYATGDGLTRNTVRKVRGRFVLVDPDDDDPTISASYSDGSVDLSGVALWDEALWDVDVWPAEGAGEWEGLAGVAPEDDGRQTFSWKIGKKARHIRFRFRSVGPASQLVLRAIEMFVRQSSKD